MVDRACNLAILTSSESTTFFVRGTGSTEDTLFMSPNFTCFNCPILAAFCWMALATGELSLSDLDLPEVDEEWWKNSQNGGKYNKLPGIVAE